MVKQIMGVSCPACHILYEIYHNSNTSYHCPECGLIIYKPKEKPMPSQKLNTRPTLPPPLPPTFRSFQNISTTRHPQRVFEDDTKKRVIRFNIVYVLFLLAIVIVFAALLFSRVSAQADVCGGESSARYISPWTLIEPNSVHSFRHGFKCTPVELDVWVSHETERRNIVIPYIEMKGAIQVTAVSQSLIIVQNNSSNKTWIRVVARP